MNNLVNSYLHIQWPECIRIKYHPKAIKVVPNNKTNYLRKPNNNIFESYMIPSDIWEEYKNKYYSPNYYHVINKKKPKTYKDIIWDRLNTINAEDQVLYDKIISLWIENYTFKNINRLDKDERIIQTV